VPAGDYLEGLVFFALTLGGVLGGSALLLARRLPQLTAAPRVVAFGLLATLGVLAVHLIPAIAGILGRETVLAAAALWLAAAAFARPVAAEPAAPPSAGSTADRLPRALAAAGVAALVLYALAVARDQLTVPTLAIDMLNFHLPGVARWIETGSIWQIDVFLPDVAPGHYPNNGDVILLAAVLPWKNDFLVHVSMYPFWALTGVGVYALGRELRAPWPAAALAGCLVLAIPSVSIWALGGSLVDAVMLASFAAGMLFLVRHQRTGSTAELVLAGLGLGIAFGTKWYAVTSVAAVVAVWAAASLLAGRGPRSVARHAAVLAGLIALAGGVWMLRNLVESGNPVFPVEVAPLGVTIFEAPRDFVRELGGFTIADYLDQPGVWREYLLPQFRDMLAAPSLLLGVSLLAAGGAIGYRRRRRGRLLPGERLALAGAVCAVLLLVAYSLTPYTAGGPRNQPVFAGADARYVIPAVVVAAGLASWAAGRLRRGMAALAALALLAIADGVRLSSNGTNGPPKLDASDWAVAALVAGLLTAVAWAALRLCPRLPRARRRHALAAIACAALAGLAGLGQGVQERFNAGRYRGFDASVDWLLDHAGSGQRIGLAGLWLDDFSPAFPAFGPRLGNEVAYVGRPDDGMLRRYRSPDEFAAALRRGSYDYLIVGRGRPPQDTIREERWALAAGFEPVARSPQLSLLRAPASRRPRDGQNGG
jgi:hypothetical protein